MLSGEKKRLAVLYVYADTQKYPRSYKYLSRLIRRIIGFEITIVRIDNFNENKKARQEEHNVYDIAGDNRYWEFSGWKTGLEFLRDKRVEPDLIMFVNDAFLNYSKKGKDYKYYKSRISSITLNRLNNSVLGLIDSHKKVEILLGHDVSSWIRTNLFVVPYSVAEQLEFPLIDDQIITEMLPIEYTGTILRKTDHLNSDLRIFLENWITREWWQARIPTIKNWGFLRSKLVAILNERMLAAKIRELNLQIVNMDSVSVI
jgi:hypothetical protein